MHFIRVIDKWNYIHSKEDYQGGKYQMRDIKEIKGVKPWEEKPWNEMRNYQSHQLSEVLSCGRGIRVVPHSSTMTWKFLGIKLLLNVVNFLTRKVLWNFSKLSESTLLWVFKQRLEHHMADVFNWKVSQTGWSDKLRCLQRPRKYMRGCRLAFIYRDGAYGTPESEVPPLADGFTLFLKHLE